VSASKAGVLQRSADMGIAAGRSSEEPAVRHAPGKAERGYRPEIDGLRAIAVVLVILYHAKIPIAGRDVFTGGFIGVDVFLVISGYLISSILLREIASGRFSVASFYERRARRILPALYVVLFATLPGAWLLLLPETAKFYGGSLFSAAASVSNIFFWHETSYDAASGLTNPLLHTWSLGVEEQFYILFPVMLIVLHRHARLRVGQWLAAITLFSLLMAEVMTALAPEASFFLLPSRAWELGIGALLAVAERHAGRTKAHPLLPLVGLGMLLASVPLLSLQHHHPGVMTLLPTLGTAAVIRFGGTQDPAGRWLASQPMVAVGLLSYSLYLWHQPVFAFGRLLLVDEPTAGIKLAWIGLAAVLAVATFILVERPMRDRRRVPARAIWIMAATGAALLMAIGGGLYRSQGAPGRFAGLTGLIARAEHIEEAEIFQDGKGCLNYVPAMGPCRFAGARPDGYNLLLLGDSHGRTLSGAAVQRLATAHSVSTVTMLNRGGCPFLLGLNRIASGAPSCPESYNRARLRYASSQRRAVAVLMMRLPVLVEHSAYDNGQRGIEGGEPAHLSVIGEPDDTFASDQAIAASLARSVQALLASGVKVVLVYPVPEMGWNIPYKLLQLSRGDPPERWLEPTQASVSRASFGARARRTQAVLDGVGTDPNLIRIYPEHALCRADRCLSHDGSRIYYRDDNHLSQTGGDLVMAEIMAAIEQRWGLAAKGFSR